MSPRKFVLTGGPCTGKSSTLKALARKGHQTAGEAARFVIKRELKRGTNTLPWLDRDGFQKAVLKRQLQIESRLNSDAFLDRGVPDGLVYYRLDRLRPPKVLLESARNNRYDRVFVLEMLPFTEKDDARREDPKTMKRIHSLVKKVYRELGYIIIEVPVMSVEDRAAFILEKT